MIKGKCKQKMFILFKNLNIRPAELENDQIKLKTSRKKIHRKVNMILEQLQSKISMYNNCLHLHKIAIEILNKI